jgi:tRNA nucleotidyltransferase/poly(A) polymerase
LSERHDAQIALMKFLSTVARRAGADEHVYVVGGAVRDFVMGRPIKDVDVVVDAVSLGRNRDSAWFAEQVVRSIPVASSYVTNQYGVAIITVKGPWVLDGQDLQGEVIEIANARKEKR